MAKILQAYLVKIVSKNVSLFLCLLSCILVRLCNGSRKNLIDMTRHFQDIFTCERYLCGRTASGETA